MLRSSARLVLSLALAQALASPPIAQAADKPAIAGSYRCKKGCRDTDAPPGIEIDDAKANCMSELGGIYFGTLLDSRSVSCFNMTGTLSPDGKQVLWSNGNIWERR